MLIKLTLKKKRWSGTARCYWAPDLLCPCAKQIVSEVWYLETVNYAICDEIILQVASWPRNTQQTAVVVNTILNLICIAGDNE